MTASSLPSSSTSEIGDTMAEETCEVCGARSDDLTEFRPGVFACPTVQRCDYNQNIGWINADIQAGIDAEIGLGR